MKEFDQEMLNVLLMYTNTSYFSTNVQAAARAGHSWAEVLFQLDELLDRHLAEHLQQHLLQDLEQHLELHVAYFVAFIFSYEDEVLVHMQIFLH